jgi:tetratricopeptide (TPR) repeat protein
MNSDQLNDLLEMGVLLAGSGQTAEARAYFSKAVKVDPESTFAWYYLGAVMEDPEKKQYCFSRAIALDAEVHQKVASLHARKATAFQGMEAAATMDSSGFMDGDDEDTGSLSVSESEPLSSNAKRKQAKPRKKASPFWILFSIMLLVLALLAGAAYWVLFLK